MKRYWTLAALIAASFLVLFLAAESLDIPVLRDPSEWLEEGGVAAAAAGVSLLTADVLLPVPSSAVMIAHGALFGVWLGMALSLLGSVGAAVVGFALGRRGGGLIARFVPAEERARADRMLQRWGSLAIVASRPVPLLAETVMILAGASPAGWGRSIAAALAGSLPPAALYALTGAMAAGVGSSLLVFLGVGGVAAVFWVLGRRAGAQEEQGELR